MESNFPGNSNAQKTTRPQKKVEKVVTGQIIQRKKPRWKRFKEIYFSGADSRSVFEYILTDIIIPSSKDMIHDVVTQGVEQKLFGEVRSRNRRAPASIFGSAAYNAYNRYSSPNTTLRPDPRQQGPAPSRRGRVPQSSLGEIVLETRAEANDVLDQMITIMDQFEVVKVSDLWDMLGVTGEFTDEKWGWSDLRGADVQRINEGYLLNLPHPVPLER